jgi:hypothetical protein
MKNVIASLELVGPHASNKSTTSRGIRLQKSDGGFLCHTME